MKYIKYFNESLGISNNVMDQGERFYDKIINSTDIKFSFLYLTEYSNCFFEVNIDPKINDKGFFNYDDSKSFEEQSLKIVLRDRKDKSTFLHELKHLDHYIRDNNFSKNGYYDIKDKIKTMSKIKISRNKNGKIKFPILDEFNIIDEILYVYEPTEFQSKYHGYYIEIDNYIKDKIKTEIPNKDNIKKWINECLKNSKDLAYTWYNGDEFKLDNYLYEKDIYKFYLIMCDSKNILAKRLFSFINIFTKASPGGIKFEEFVIKFERAINKKKKVYHKKFKRLYTIFFNKYIK